MKYIKSHRQSKRPKTSTIDSESIETTTDEAHIVGPTHKQMALDSVLESVSADMFHSRRENNNRLLSIERINLLVEDLVQDPMNGPNLIQTSTKPLSFTNQSKYILIQIYDLQTLLFCHFNHLSLKRLAGIVSSAIATPSPSTTTSLPPMTLAQQRSVAHNHRRAAISSVPFSSSPIINARSLSTNPIIIRSVSNVNTPSAVTYQSNVIQAAPGNVVAFIDRNNEQRMI